MSRACRITPRASRDIGAIADYLAAQSSLASAENFLSGIDSTLQRIAQFPQIRSQTRRTLPWFPQFALREILNFLPPPQ
nr:type II toxin-antitoxin system RelE/ParE family toxin [Leptolyngbya sp. NK1-12]